MASALAKSDPTRANTGVSNSLMVLRT